MAEGGSGPRPNEDAELRQEIEDVLADTSDLPEDVNDRASLEFLGYVEDIIRDGRREVLRNRRTRQGSDQSDSSSDWTDISLHERPPATRTARRTGTGTAVDLIGQGPSGLCCCLRVLLLLVDHYKHKARTVWNRFKARVREALACLMNYLLDKFAHCLSIGHSLYHRALMYVAAY